MTNITNTYRIEYRIAPPAGRFGPAMTRALARRFHCTIDAADETEALRLSAARAAKLWEGAGTYEATRIRVHGQGYRESRVVVGGVVS